MDKAGLFQGFSYRLNGYWRAAVQIVSQHAKQQISEYRNDDLSSDQHFHNIISIFLHIL